MPRHFRRYYQYIERDTSKISGLWKAIHALIFILIVINSFCSAFTFHDIFDSFHFQCILYSKPFLRLQKPTKNVTRLHVTGTPSMDASVTASTLPMNDEAMIVTTALPDADPALTSTETTTTTTLTRMLRIRQAGDESSTPPTTNRPVSSSTTALPGSDLVTTALPGSDLDTTALPGSDLDTTAPEGSESDATLTSTKKHQKKTTIPTRIETKGGRYWEVTGNVSSMVMLDGQILYGRKAVCNSVLFFPLSSLVLGSFAAVMIIICGKGGKGYPTDILLNSYAYVYPILIFSIIMVLVSCMITYFLVTGMREFCKGFKRYTLEEVCSTKLDYFTDGGAVGGDALYERFMVTLICSYVEIGLWVAQAVWTATRIICAPDFQLMMVKVSSARRRSLGFEDDPVHDVMMDSFRGMKKAPVPANVYDSDLDSVNVPTHSQRKKPRKGPKRVTFADEDSTETSDDQGRSPTRVQEALNKKQKGLKKWKGSSKENLSNKDNDEDTTHV